MMYSERDVDIGVGGCKFVARLGVTKAFRGAGITLDRTPLAGSTDSSTERLSAGNVQFGCG